MSADCIDLASMAQARNTSRAEDPQETEDNMINVNIQDEETISASPQTEGHSLPPTDRGRLAWLVLAIRPSCGPVGLIIMVVALIASTFTDNVSALVATQGVLRAIGSGLLFAPTTLYLDEWFVQRRGLAYGIMWSGKSLVGVALPLAMEADLERFGFRTVLRAWAVFAVSTPSPASLNQHRGTRRLADSTSVSSGCRRSGSWRSETHFRV